MSAGRLLKSFALFSLDFTVLQVDGFVLVGGKSSRMGTNKFALRFGGATFAERAVAALEKISAGRVSFVVGAHQTNEIAELLPLAVRRVADVFPHKAAAAGIYTALTVSKSEWTAILACDYPFVTEDLFLRLAKIAASADKTAAAVAPVQRDGRIQPLCTLYRTNPCLEIAARLLESDEIPPARRLLENAATRPVDFKELADLDGADDFFTNVNTPEDFLRIQN